MHRQRSGRWGRVALVVGALLMPTAATAQRADGVAPLAARTIRVVGTGEVRVRPDEAEVLFAVESFAETARAAGQQNARAMERVIRALVASGVPRAELETRNYSVHPEYVHEEGRREPRIRGYRATNQVVLRTRELERVGERIDIALGAGANRMDGVSFRVREMGTAQADAVREAVRRARAQAEAMAAALGVRLGPVLDAATGAHAPPPMPMYRRAMESDIAVAAAAPTPIQPEEQSVMAQVSLVYEIAGGS